MTTINERMADAVMRGGRPTKGESRALPSAPMMRDQCLPRSCSMDIQVAKRHDMALSALRRTLDDTHDQARGAASQTVASMAWRRHAVDAIAIHAGRRRALGEKSNTRARGGRGFM